MRSERGFTILEVLVALSLMAIVAAGLVPAFTTFLKFNTRAEIKSEALSAAQQVLDELRLVDPATMPSSGSDPAVNITLGSRTYQVIVDYCVDASLCTSTTRQLVLEVFDNNAESVYSTQTVYTKLR